MEMDLRIKSKDVQCQLIRNEEGQKMLTKEKKKVLVFGFKDTFCGQIVNSQQFKKKYEIVKIITEKIPTIDEDKLHKRNPVNTCEYVQGNTIFGAEILEGENGWKYLKEIRNDNKGAIDIFGVFILEDKICERKRIYERIKSEIGEKLKILSWVSETAVVDEYSQIGEGSIITHQCYIGYKAEIGKSVLMQTGGLLEHHSKIGNFVNICPRFASGSFVNIEDEVQINIGITIFNRIKIGKGACIGAGSLVTKNCEKNMLYFGRPAKYRRKVDEE